MRYKNKNTIAVTTILILLAIFIASCSSEVTVLKNDEEKQSYALGVSFAERIQLKEQENIDINAFIQGIRDAASDKKDKKLLSEEEHKKALERAIANIERTQIKKQKQELKENFEKAQNFLVENKKNNQKIVETESGLQYEILTEGKGKSPQKTSTVIVHYKGELQDGKVFDSSYDRGTPAELKIADLIPAWKEALLLMKPGSKWKLYVRPDLAYGERAVGNIPANSLLKFEVELIKVKK